MLVTLTKFCVSSSSMNAGADFYFYTLEPLKVRMHQQGNDNQLKHTNPDGSIWLIHWFISCLVSRFCCLLQVSLSEKFTVHIQAWIKPLCWRLWSWGSGAKGPEPVGRSENSCWSGSWAVMCSAALGKRVCFTNWRIKTSKNQVIYSHLLTKFPPKARWMVLLLTQNIRVLNLLSGFHDCRSSLRSGAIPPQACHDVVILHQFALFLQMLQTEDSEEQQLLLLWFCCSRCCRSFIEVLLRVLQNLANDQCPTRSSGTSNALVLAFIT